MPTPPDTPLHTRLLARIRETGPLSVAEYMTLCLLDPVDGYYPTRDPLGVDGDFVTAPEISQMFGEALGLWVVQAWQDIGAPDRFNLVELGPGRGVMMADMLRAMRLSPPCFAACDVTLVEASAALQAVQAKTLGPSEARVAWAKRLEDVSDAPTLIVGNEFLDCLPIRQFVRTDGAWSERRVGAEDGDLRFEIDGRPAPTALVADLPDAEDGALLEVCPASAQIVDHLAERFAAQPGRALFIDYGPAETEFGDTLQAIVRHEKVDPLADPGNADLTARVDFEALREMANAAELDVAGPATQAAFLSRLGIEVRASALARANPDSQALLGRQLKRLTGAEEMGELFKAVCVSAPGLPEPLGFGA